MKRDREWAKQLTYLMLPDQNYVIHTSGGNWCTQLPTSCQLYFLSATLPVSHRQREM